VARQAWQPRCGPWRPKTGDGTVPWPLPDRPGQGIMTELVSSTGGRIRCRKVLAFQRSGAHTGHYVALLQTPAAALLQTPAAAKIADPGVKLSAEPSRVVTGVRSVSHAHGVRLRRGRDTSQRGQERISRHEPIEKPRRRRISRSASPLSRGVTTPDLPEGI
jgi:hypothetical protein